MILILAGFLAYEKAQDIYFSGYRTGAQAGYEQGYQQGYQRGKQEAITKLPFKT